MVMMWSSWGASVTATDMPQVLPNLRANIAATFPDTKVVATRATNTNTNTNTNTSSSVDVSSPALPLVQIKAVSLGWGIEPTKGSAMRHIIVKSSSTGQDSHKPTMSSNEVDEEKERRHQRRARGVGTAEEESSSEEEDDNDVRWQWRSLINWSPLSYDMIVLADCLYLEELQYPLLQTLRALMTPSSIVLMAQHTRRPRVERRFRRRATQRFGINVHQLYVQHNVPSSATDHLVTVTIYQLSLPSPSASS
jgi:hypothetical protein